MLEHHQEDAVDPIESLTRRLGRLEMIEAARACLTRYARACDALDHRALAEQVFAPDAVLHIPGADYHGRDAIVAFFATAFAAAPRMQRHFLANPVTEIVGDDTVAISAYFLYLSTDGGIVLGCGTYRDLVHVHDGIGRVRDKTIAVEVMQPLAGVAGPTPS